MERLWKGARSNFYGSSRHWRRSNNWKGTEIKRTEKNKKSNVPRATAGRILNYKVKVEILKNPIKVEDKNIFIIENFWQGSLEYHKELRKEGKHLMEKGEINYFQYRPIAVESKNKTGWYLVKTYR